MRRCCRTGFPERRWPWPERQCRFWAVVVTLPDRVPPLTSPCPATRASPPPSTASSGPSLLPTLCPSVRSHVPTSAFPSLPSLSQCGGSCRAVAHTLSVSENNSRVQCIHDVAHRLPVAHSAPFRPHGRARPRHCVGSLRSSVWTVRVDSFPLGAMRSWHGAALRPAVAGGTAPHSSAVFGATRPTADFTEEGRERLVPDIQSTASAPAWPPGRVASLWTT